MHVHKPAEVLRKVDGLLQALAEGMDTVGECPGKQDRNKQFGEAHGECLDIFRSENLINRHEHVPVQEVDGKHAPGEDLGSTMIAQEHEGEYGHVQREYHDVRDDLVGDLREYTLICQSEIEHSTMLQIVEHGEDDHYYLQ